MIIFKLAQSADEGRLVCLKACLCFPAKPVGLLKDDYLFL